MIIYNCHTHIMTHKDIPANFLPFGLVRMLSKTKVTRGLAKALNWIHPFTHDDLLDRYARFIRIGSKNNQLEIFDLLINSYYEISEKMELSVEEFKFITLSMDMAYMGAGKVPRTFIEQLDGMADLKRQYPENIYPFICFDPRRPFILQIAKDYLENHNFAGVKIYPALGFYPYDNRFNELYEYCQFKQIPIMYHCSRGGIWFREETTGWFKNRYKQRQKDCWKYSDPENYKKVLTQFPDLKICLAHWGGEQDWIDYFEQKGNFDDNWFLKITELLKEYPHTFTDISYTLYKKQYGPILKLLVQNPYIRERILFGSDFYIVEMDAVESQFMELYNKIGKMDFLQISTINPCLYLHSFLKNK